MDLNTGVYCILNTANGKRYVGSAALSFDKRWALHRSRLRRGKHDNIHLQNAWRKYGEDAFVFEIIERCIPTECVVREQQWIDWHKATDPRAVYNIHPTAGSPLGCKLSDEHRAMIAAGNRRAWASGERSRSLHGPESRAKIAAANRARSPESRKRHADLLRGRKHNEEVKAKRAASLRAAWASGRFRRNLTAEAREKMGAATRGKKRSAEFGAKVSAGLMGRQVSKETRAKIGEANAIALKGKKLSAETRAKISAAHKARRRSADTTPVFPAFS